MNSRICLFVTKDTVWTHQRLSVQNDFVGKQNDTETRAFLLKQITQDLNVPNQEVNSRFYLFVTKDTVWMHRRLWEQNDMKHGFARWW